MPFGAAGPPKCSRINPSKKCKRFLSINDRKAGFSECCGCRKSSRTEPLNTNRARKLLEVDLLAPGFNILELRITNTAKFWMERAKRTMTDTKKNGLECTLQQCMIDELKDNMKTLRNKFNVELLCVPRFLEEVDLCRKKALLGGQHLYANLPPIVHRHKDNIPDFARKCEDFYKEVITRGILVKGETYTKLEDNVKVTDGIPLHYYETVQFCNKERVKEFEDQRTGKDKQMWKSIKILRDAKDGHGITLRKSDKSPEYCHDYDKFMTMVVKASLKEVRKKHKFIGASSWLASEKIKKQWWRDLDDIKTLHELGMLMSICGHSCLC